MSLFDLIFNLQDPIPIELGGGRGRGSDWQCGNYDGEKSIVIAPPESHRSQPAIGGLLFPLRQATLGLIPKIMIHDAKGGGC